MFLLKISFQVLSPCCSNSGDNLNSASVPPVQQSPDAQRLTPMDVSCYYIFLYSGLLNSSVFKNFNLFL